MGRRTWIKVYVDKWLRGTLREETASTRGIWIDILTLAGDSAFGDIGEIKLGISVGMTDEQISKIIFVDLKEWLTAKQRLVKTERIKIKKNNTITILNWDKYQSEYQRQKTHSPKSQEKKDNVCPEVQQKVRGDRERDREGDRDINKDSSLKSGGKVKSKKENQLEKDVAIKKNITPTKQLFGVFQSIWLTKREKEYKFTGGKDGSTAQRLWRQCKKDSSKNPLEYFTERVRAIMEQHDIYSFGGVETFWNSTTAKKKSKSWID